MEINSNTTVNKSKIDLTSCEIEPIHIPGKIQSHGFLLAINRATRTISYISENVNEFIQADSAQLLNGDLKNFISLTNIDARYVDLEKLMEPAADADYGNINPIKVKFSNDSFNLIVHSSNNFILFEFEPAELIKEKELHRLIGVSLSKILEARTLEKTLQFAAKQVKEIIGYDRVMIYKFREDEHGEVIAEEKNEDIEPFLGLHYPASDIPRQARELYKLNLVRIIANVDSTPAALLVTDPHFATAPLDLTHSTLRAVSPVHIEYLKNMGVKASFSISIVVKERLWGLIACHNYEPAFIGYEARNNAKLISKILSSSLEYREEEKIKEEGIWFEKALREIIPRAGSDLDIVDSLIFHDTNILNLTEADGAALFFENKLYTLGTTPSEDEISDLIKWLGNSKYQSLFQTDHLSALFSPAHSYKNIASGLLSCTISPGMKDCILWFRPEFKKTVKWAGNPDRPAEINREGNSRLSPRRSFEEWIQEVEGVSAPWSKAETFSAMRAREEIVYLVNQKANQVSLLNEKLKEAYKELDTFSFTISHDLKTPLTAIKSYTELLLEDYFNMTTEANEILRKVVKNADYMDLLIKEVLSYSRIEREELNAVELNTKSIMENIKNDLMAVYGDTGIGIVISGTPPIMGDKIMIYQVFANIIGNAVKYSAKAENPMVIINGTETDNEIVYTIQDNGVGIDMNYGTQVFDLFKRMENANDYEGTGIGLAIVKRIMEKHEARIWYESELSKGTIFYLAFKKQATNIKFSKS